MMRFGSFSFLVAALCLSPAAIAAEDNIKNLRGRVRSHRRLNSADRGCIEAVYAFRYAYCDALRGRITNQEWAAVAGDFFAPTITTSTGGAGGQEVWNGILELVDEVNGLVPYTKRTITGDYLSCVTVFGDNYYVKDESAQELTVVLSSVKATSWVDSPVLPPFSTGGPGKFFEYEEDEYTCVWLISTYEDPNTVLVSDRFSFPKPRE